MTTAPVIRTLLLLTVVSGAATGCAARTSGPAPEPVPPEYASLPDALVCVVDRSVPLGLREIPAKTRGGEIVLLVDGEIRTLESVHPIDFLAGYAGRESWLTRGEAVTLEGRSFARTGGERRVALNLLRRAGEFRGILLFAAADDASPPDALYVPTAPGCIFQAYVREDLIRR